MIETSAQERVRTGEVGSRLSLACVESEPGLQTLLGEWDDLLLEMPRPSPFLSRNWIETWWAHFGANSRLMVVTARDENGRLAGVAPLQVTPRRSALGLVIRSLEFLGYRGFAPCADHLDFLSRGEHREEVVAELVNQVLRLCGRWDRIWLADLAEDSLVPVAWRAATAAADLDWSEQAAAVCYYRPLPADVPTLQAEIRQAHPKLANNLKYYRKKLEQAYRTRFEFVQDRAAAAETMQALARLHGAAHQRKGEAGNFAMDDYRHFHTDLVQRLVGGDQLYLARLTCDDLTVAVLYGYFQAGVLYYYQSGFDTEFKALGVGTLMLGWVLEDAVERLGAREFDFLRGSEEYKTRWAKGARHTVTLVGWRRSLIPRLGRLEHQARRSLAPVRARLRAQLRTLGTRVRRQRPAGLEPGRSQP